MASNRVLLNSILESSSGAAQIKVAASPSTKCRRRLQSQLTQRCKKNIPETCLKRKDFDWVFNFIIEIAADDETMMA